VQAGVIHQRSIEQQTQGRGLYEFTTELQQLVAAAGVQTGLCNVFCNHTSASLIINENADPAVLRDLEAFMGRLVPDGDALYTHTAEGSDDMPAHVRSVLTQTSVSVPISNGRCDLGTWQGLFLWEHRTRPHQRRITITVVGQ
jgi:secondary thiamine-phosphate synthase enzyme